MAAITIMRPRAEVEQRWHAAGHDTGGTVAFRDAPGDRGTEVHVRDEDDRARTLDVLRRFKQILETGEIARSEGAPEGERAERKLKQHPARPLSEDELEKAGV